MADLQKLRLELCMTSVFRNVLEKPLFKHFAAYLEDGATRDEKIKAYGAFVSEIYANGGSLTNLVSRLVFEDENVYIKSRAHKAHLDKNIVIATQRELKVFEKIAMLTAEDFKADMELEYVLPQDIEKRKRKDESS